MPPKLGARGIGQLCVTRVLAARSRYATQLSRSWIRGPSGIDLQPARCAIAQPLLERIVGQSGSNRDGRVVALARLVSRTCAIAAQILLSGTLARLLPTGRLGSADPARRQVDLLVTDLVMPLYVTGTLRSLS